MLGLSMTDVMQGRRCTRNARITRVANIFRIALTHRPRLHPPQRQRRHRCQHQRQHQRQHLALAMLSQHWSMTIGARRIALPVSAPVISASATVLCWFKRCEQEWFVCFAGGIGVQAAIYSTGDSPHLSISRLTSLASRPVSKLSWSGLLDVLRCL